METRCRHMTNLADIIGWSHRLSAEVLQSGDMAVDLTLGNGNDCLHLAHSVGARTTGAVIAFDIQYSALERSASLLAQEGFCVSIHSDGDMDSPAVRTEPWPDTTTGVHLFHSGHQELQRHLPRAPKLILANLGYLPGGDHAIATTAPTSIRAAEQGVAALLPGGRMLFVVYPGHPEGQTEAAELNAFFSALPKQKWDVIRIGCPNAAQAPFLLGAERRR